MLWPLRPHHGHAEARRMGVVANHPLRGAGECAEILNFGPLVCVTREGVAPMFAATMPHWAAHQPLENQHGPEQALPHSDQQAPLLARHLWTHEDPPEGQ